MRRKRRTETTIEMHQMWVVTRTDKSSVISCAGCPGASSLLVAPEEAAVLLGISPRVVYRWIEADMIHYFETPLVGLFVCIESVARRASSNKFISEGERA